MDPCPAPFNLAGYVLAAGRRTPDKIALALLGPTRSERWSYARLIRAVEGMAGGLRAAGLTPGDRVLLRLGNTPAFPVGFLGALAADLVPVPTAAGLTVPEITALARAIDPAAILAEDGITLPGGCRAPVLTDLASLMAHHPIAPVAGDPDRAGYIVFTSGSSGRPKPVVHAHRAIWARRMMWDGWYGLTPGDRLLHSGAFNWTYTLGTGLMDPWAIGATALIPAPGTGPEALPLLLRRHDATIFASVPGIYRKLLSRDAALDLPRLRHGLSAGEKLPERLRSAWRRATGTELHEALGMSECSTFISGAPGRPAPEGRLGFPQPGRRIAILSEDGNAVARGDTGILAVHRDDPGLCLGYLDGNRTELPLAGNWFLTGDLVSEASDGALGYHGRRDDLLTTGGFRIAPAEIEAVFTAAPEVGDCAACAVTVKADTAVLALIHTGPADESALRALAETHLADYKRPRLYLRRPALPRSANGKLDRRALPDLVKGAT